MNKFHSKWWNKTLNVIHTNFDSEHLSKLGLSCERSNTPKFFIYNKDRSFMLHLDKYDYNNVEKIYTAFLRTEKLKKITNKFKN